MLAQGARAFRASTEVDSGGRSDAPAGRLAEARGMTTHIPSPNSRRLRATLALTAAALAFGGFTASGVSAAVTFKLAAHTPALSDPWSLALADLNQDGRPDIVAPSVGGNSANVALGRASGVFAPTATTASTVAGGNAYYLAVEDFDAMEIPTSSRASTSARTRTTRGSSVPRRRSRRPRRADGQRAWRWPRRDPARRLQRRRQARPRLCRLHEQRPRRGRRRGRPP
jgi:hypothetical protein